MEIKMNKKIIIETLGLESEEYITLFSAGTTKIKQPLMRLL